jgi:hypothetical protein
MRWCIDIFYLHPLPVVFLVLASYAVAASWLLPRGAKTAQKAATSIGLKQISLNKFLQYFNYPHKVIGNHDLDGSKAGMPIVESILIGRYDDFTVTLFMFCLPTGGACQANCRLSYAAFRVLLPSPRTVFVTTVSRSGLSVTAVTGVQSRVSPDHRRGFASLPRHREPHEL